MVKFTRGGVRPTLTAGFAVLLLSCSTKPQDPILVRDDSDRSALTSARIEEILESFVQDFRDDPMAIDSYFGVKVGDYWWTVSSERKEATRDELETGFPEHQVTLRRGEPERPTWFYEFADPETLRMFDSGELSAGTAYARSFGSDTTALNASTMDGYHSDFRDLAQVYHLNSHFWTKGIPEVTRFERDRSMSVHGASMVTLYSMKEKRVIWFSIGPEEVVNDEAGLEWGETPNLFIFTKGRGQAEFADQEMEVEEGMSVFIGPYVKHVISNPHEEPLEGILLLYGDNSQFTGDTSFIEFTEDYYDFVADYEY